MILLGCKDLFKVCCFLLLKYLHIFSETSSVSPDFLVALLVSKTLIFAFLWLWASPRWLCVGFNEETHRNRKLFQSFTGIFPLWTNTPIQTQLNHGAASWNQCLNLVLQVESPTPRQAHSLVNSMNPGDNLSPLARKQNKTSIYEHKVILLLIIQGKEN